MNPLEGPRLAYCNRDALRVVGRESASDDQGPQAADRCSFEACQGFLGVDKVCMSKTNTVGVQCCRGNLHKEASTTVVEDSQNHLVGRIRLGTVDHVHFNSAVRRTTRVNINNLSHFELWVSGGPAIGGQDEIQASCVKDLVTVNRAQRR